MILTATGMYILYNRLINRMNSNEESNSRTFDEDPIELKISPQTISSIREQIPHSIYDFSSQYGSNGSDSYVVSNVCSYPEIFPMYGDSTHSLVFRTYGPWWINAPSYRETIKNFTRREYHFTSRDFIEIEFQDMVHECISLKVYETYNPGTLEAVYAGEEDEFRNIKWHRVWTFPEPFSIILSNNTEHAIENGYQSMRDLFPTRARISVPLGASLQFNTDHKQVARIYTHHSYPPAARLPRIVKIPLKDKVSFPTKLFRLEFDHSTVNYYAEIDTIILHGRTSPPNSIPKNHSIVDEILAINIDENQGDTTIKSKSETLEQLPFDILFIICSYLDLRSLIRLSSTCRSLHNRCLHPLQFQSLNLQPYWCLMTDYSIERFFLQHCSQTKYLSLAWTKSLQYSSFSQLFNVCSDNLVQLNLACCQYLTGPHLQIIVNKCPNIEILSLENCISLKKFDFIPLKELKHLRTLNLYRTKIDYRTLLPLIDNNKNTLENINLGTCQKLGDTIGIIRLLFSRCVNLRSIDLWRIQGLTLNGFLSVIGLPYNDDEEKRRMLSLGKDEQVEMALIYSSVNMPMQINSIAHMQYLSEVDIGWTDPPSGFVKSFVQQIGNSLIKLFLTACRRVDNEDVKAVSEHCPQLRQLDLLGSSIIVEETIESVLSRCTKLKFLDLSFCDKITDEAIAIWILTYRHCFKRSYSPRRNDDILDEFA